MHRKYFLVCILLLPLQACNFSVKVLGRVFDKETGLPLARTTVNLLEGKDIKKTNTNGYFEVSSDTRPFQNPIILITKDGYKPFQLKIKERNGDATSYIVKSESIFIDYEKPVYPDPNNRGTFITGTWIDKWSKEFKTGDTLSIYLAKEDTKTEIEKIRKGIEGKSSALSPVP
ncbi:hypothetical protein GCM10027275_34130 [Rhabdobacter roseus]|uniref:Carboxypeptidase regulatory-like domain-containing protein n=1 Tax=Rhabdobacter roseus TaxID=1655419 RepID=A0A840TR19_9BACT|nr:hypothetical protein [Rhabdobacter roseus]MBB5285365.1 hypothetical protein [Rhabdobacter roseus]